MMKSFKARNVPVDGVGIQMHVDVGSWRGDSLGFAANLSANIANITSLGLEYQNLSLSVCLSLSLSLSFCSICESIYPG